MTGVYRLRDRLLHRLAFSGLAIQESVADVEALAYRSRLAPIVPDAPIFITSLPRAGTTLLLDLLTQDESLSSTTYRDMPFLLCPMFWRAVSLPFHVKQTLRERAHADGIMVGPDSPEAFEEVIWRHFWKRKYTRGRILPWRATDHDSVFEKFFRNHMRKTIALARGGSAGYVSKNNTNIARLPYLTRMFPGGRQVVPFRAPLAHAQSLLRQHRRFLALQAQDAFGRRYMADLGHLEFGELFNPIAFDNTPLGDPLTPDHWMRYWLAAYRHVLETRTPATVFVNHEALRARPAAVVGALFERLELSPEAAMRAAAAVSPPSAEVACDCDPHLLAQAQDVYDALMKLS